MDKDLIYSIIDAFAKKGLVFSNEQDFQFEFARALMKCKEVKRVKLEAMSLSNDWKEIETKISEKQRITRDTKEYTDVLVETTNGEYIAIELKYKTADKVCMYIIDKKKYITMAQGAYDFNAYDFIKDISRLEKINQRYFIDDISVSKGYAIILTNYKHYRYNDFSGSSIWHNYAINDKRFLNGKLLFKKEDDCLKTGGREFTSIELKNQYSLEWHDYKLQNYTDYEDKAKSNNPGFSYLVVGIECCPRVK